VLGNQSWFAEDIVIEEEDELAAALLETGVD
jgi:hypothetical protein